MINTRLTIFDALNLKFKRLFNQADNDRPGFKKIMYAVILNDMKEWIEFKGDDISKIESILKKYLQDNCVFNVKRFRENLRDYKNVNTPQSNAYWRRVWDNENFEFAEPNAHDQQYGPEVFRIVDGVIKICQDKTNAQYDETTGTMSLEIHDKTLFENGK